MCLQINITATASLLAARGYLKCVKMAVSPKGFPRR